MLRKLIFLWSGAICAVVVHSQVLESRVVNITQGPVRGYREPANIFAFYNIPYATVTERFKAPIPPPTWTETFDAVDKGIMCPQHIFSRQQEPVPSGYFSTIALQEDCLVANIFVPDTEERNLPVLVNVHGGGFQNGFGESERLTILAGTKKIIVVTFNYRVGVFGFLCLGTEKAPGNAGLKDQVALLRWVQQNIAYFGGNPGDVTISGCSAGSGCVDLLTISQATRGLFSKSITDSGSNIGAFAIQQDPIKNAMDSGRAFNFTNVENLSALEESYRTASIETLTSIPYSGNPDSAIAFSPCIERDVGEERILTEAPYAILKRGDHVRFPRYYGFTNMEGIMRIREFPVWGNAMNENFSDFLPADLKFETQSQKDEVAKMVKEYYFGDQPVSFENLLPYIDYFTDINFAYSMLRAVKLHVDAGNSTIYLHMYSFYDNNTNPVPNTDVRGATHCAQSRAVYDQDETNFTEAYKRMKTIMRELWGSFIITGKPVVEDSSLPMWSPVGANRSPHMSLGRTVELKGPLLEARARFWDAIYEKHYSLPEPPTTDSAVVHKNACLVYFLMLLYLFY